MAHYSTTLWELKGKMYLTKGDMMVHRQKNKVWENIVQTILDVCLPLQYNMVVVDILKNVQKTQKVFFVK